MADGLDRARSILGSSGAGSEPAWKLWVRLDSGNDSAENLDVIREHGGELLIKRNLRRGETPTSGLTVAHANQDATGTRSFATRPGTIVYQGEVLRVPKPGHAEERIVYQVIERTITPQGQILCGPEIEVATYWTSLPDPLRTGYPGIPTMAPGNRITANTRPT